MCLLSCFVILSTKKPFKMSVHNSIPLETADSPLVFLKWCLSSDVKDRSLKVEYVFDEMSPTEICYACFAELKGSRCSNMVLYSLYKLWWAVSDQDTLTPDSGVVLVLSKLVRSKCNMLRLLDVYRHCTICGPSKILLTQDLYEVMCDKVAAAADTAQLLREFCSELPEEQLEYFKRIGFTGEGFVKTLKRKAEEEEGPSKTPPPKKAKSDSPPPQEAFKEKMQLARTNSTKFLHDIQEGRQTAFDTLDHLNFFSSTFGYNGFQNVLGKDLLQPHEIQEPVIKTFHRLYAIAKLSASNDEFQRNLCVSIFGGNMAGRRIAQLVGKSHLPQLFNHMCKDMGPVGQSAEDVCKRIGKWKNGVDRRDQVRSAVEGPCGGQSPPEELDDENMF